MTKWDTELTFTVDEFVDDDRIDYLAAAPADYRQSFSGSGLPHPNLYQAYSGTPNKGTVKLYGQKATIRLLNPNAYYDNTLTRTEPHVLVRFKTNGIDRIVDIKIGRGISSRDIMYTDHGPAHDSVVAGQEALLCAMEYEP